MQKEHAEIEHEVSSGNVFADLGYADAEEALAKAELARAIGATGTPAFIVGSQVFTGAVGSETLKKAIADARAGR